MDDDKKGEDQQQNGQGIGTKVKSYLEFVSVGQYPTKLFVDG
jgi:hypothetical protein